jgi:hypothetical protein
VRSRAEDNNELTLSGAFARYQLLLATATRWFIKTKGVWRQLHHHGSIEEPTLLADYQRAIFGAPLDTPA